MTNILLSCDLRSKSLIGWAIISNIAGNSQVIPEFWRIRSFAYEGCDATISLILSSSERIFPSAKMSPRHFSRL